MQQEFTSILVIREEYYPDTTIGKMYVDGCFFSYTLEDAVRPEWLKISDKTAIPAGHYIVKCTPSPKFKRITPEIFNVPNFFAIRIHGGNTHEDTSGCILIADNKGDKKIWGSAEQKLTTFLQTKTIPTMITIVNKPKS